ncbi:MAG: KilA-N domain-containing protein [Clostridia bacterium]|nr:KilA-N domain-containing protein [Clostridia bacterium]
MSLRKDRYYMNMNELLKNFNSNDLKQINDFLNSSQGKNVSGGLSNKDKQNILNQFMQLDPNKVKNKLGGLTKEDILKMLK